MQRYTVYLFLENCSTRFGWYLYPSPGTHTTVFTVSGTCQTVDATCRCCGRVGTGLSVVWELYWSVLVRLLMQLHQNRSIQSSSSFFLPFFLSSFLSFFPNSPTQARASSFTRFLDHTQWRATDSRTPLDEWSARRRDLYLTSHNTHNRQTAMPPVGFEPTISAGDRPQTYALDRAATGISHITTLW